MKILNYFDSECPEHWLRQIGRSDWSAARLLERLLRGGTFRSRMGETSRLLLLTEGDSLLAFCTYAERDEIPDPALKPWCGFVYTYPEACGKRRAGKLLEHVYALAKADGYPCVYISTNEVGLYEKYGCTFWKHMATDSGERSRVYRLPIETRDYGGIIGQRVSGTVDRPMGSAHPDRADMIYPINYGYVDGLMAGDGEEQDVYLLGTDRPLRRFTGEVIGVLHRLNDCEDKWIVSVDGSRPPREEILEAIAFQEQYYMGELYT